MMENSNKNIERLTMRQTVEQYRSSMYSIAGLEAVPLSENLAHWQASIVGPSGSPYEGGIFYLYIYLPEEYAHQNEIDE